MLRRGEHFVGLGITGVEEAITDPRLAEAMRPLKSELIGGQSVGQSTFIASSNQLVCTMDLQLRPIHVLGNLQRCAGSTCCFGRLTTPYNGTRDWINSHFGSKMLDDSLPLCSATIVL